MLLINRHGPAELNQLFERISRDQMLQLLDKHEDLLPVSWGKLIRVSRTDHELLGAVVHSTYLALGSCVNKELDCSSPSDIGCGQVVVVYSPLGDGFNRGQNRRARNALMPTIDEICFEAERGFCIELLKPYPDIARRFDDKIF